MQLPLEIMLLTQELTFARTISRRHLPDCTTMGMFVPDGTPVSVNAPAAFVVVAVAAARFEPAH